MFGTLGKDCPIEQIQNDIMTLKGTGAWDVEILKSVILFLLLRYNAYATDRKAALSTVSWITGSLMWYKINRGLPIEFESPAIIKKTRPRIEFRFEMIPTQIRDIISDLIERSYLTPKKVVEGKKIVNTYKLTSEGVEYTSKIYMKILADERMTKRILDGYEHVVHSKPWDLAEEIANC